MPARRTERPRAVFDFPGIRACWRCRGVSEAAQITRIAKRRHDTLSLCVACLAEALEALTGYKWVAQLEQWRTQSEAAKEAISGGVASARTDQRQRERANRRKRQKVEASG